MRFCRRQAPKVVFNLPFGDFFAFKRNWAEIFVANVRANTKWQKAQHNDKQTKMYFT